MTPKRARIPYGSLGTLEVKYLGPVSRKGHSFGSPPECTIADYGNIPRDVLQQDVWFVDDDDTPPGSYQVRKFPEFRSPDNWAVISSSGAIASCRMGELGDHFGTEDSARKWAAHLNKLFGSSE